MRMKNLKRWGLIVLASFILQACVKNYFEFDKISTQMEWNPNIAVPLINTTMGISDILRDTGATSFLDVDSTNLFSIVYSQQLYSQTAQEFIEIQNQNYFEQFSRSDFNSAGGFVNDSVVMTKENVPFPFSVALTQILDSMFLKTANMRIQVSSSFNHTGILELTFPSMTLNGIPYKRIIQINSSNGSFTYDEMFSEFEDYFIDLSNFGLTSNSFFVNYKLTLYDAGSGQVSNNANATVTIDFTDIEYKFLFGYFGNMDQLFPADSFAISVFEKISDANAGLSDPRFSISLHNSFGIPLRFGFEVFSSYSNLTQTYTNFQGDSVPNFEEASVPFYANIPAYNFLQTIAPVHSKRTMTKDGSNIDVVFSSLPRLILFQTGYILNPEELPVSQNNFIAENSVLDIDIDMEIPLFGYAEYAGLKDTFNLDLSGIFGDIAELEFGLIRFEFNNGLPVDVLLQGYFLENLGEPPLDSLFSLSSDQILIKAGELNDNFRVNQETGKKFKESFIELDNNKMQKIENTKYLILWFNVRTADNENQTPVKFYSDYTIDFKMGMQVQGKINF